MASPCWGNLNTPAPWMGDRHARPTRLDNVFELLDEPGEWYLDRTAGTLFYMPPAGQDPMSMTIIAPVLERLVSVAGTFSVPVHNIRFTGLTFSHATWLKPATSGGFAEMQANFTQDSPTGDGSQGFCDVNSPSCNFAAWTKPLANVNFIAAKNIVLTGDTFTHLGGAGLGFELGSTDDSVTTCAFTDISANGIQIGGTDDARPTDSRATVANITVSQSYIHDLPAEYLGGVAIFVGYTTGVQLAQNQISNTSYSGISIGWGGWARSPDTPDPAVLQNVSRSNLITQNHVFNVLQLLGDGGPLYSNGHRGTTAANGDVYTANHFHDSFHYGNGVYDDIGSNFVTVQNQVAYNVPSSWGGCAASSDLTFKNGFWVPSGANFGCLDPSRNFVTTNVQDLNNTLLATGDPSADCEANSTCGGILAVAGPPPPSFDVADGRGEMALIDDQDPNVSYSPNQWTSEANGSGFLLAHSRHYTSTNGASLSYTFVGTGIDYLAESDFNRGNVSITVDGVARPTVNCRTQQEIANQVCTSVRGLTPGSHTLTMAKLDGDYMVVDGLRVYTAAPQEGIATDDQAAGITYAGSSWSSVSRSGFNEFANTVHFTTADTDSYTVSFTGTGLDVFCTRDSNRGAIDFSVDGAFVEQVNAFTNAPLASQQLVFSVRNLTQGSHTVTAVKRGGTYMDLDRVNIRSTARINDDDTTSLTYSGSWGDSNNRGLGDFNDDVHYTTHDGDSVTVSFSGTGIEIISETFTDEGAADVVVDGIPRGRIFAFRPGARASQQTVFRLRGLARTTHAVKITKRGAPFLVIDAFNLLQ
jgi:hypothetical protein